MTRLGPVALLVAVAGLAGCQQKAKPQGVFDLSVDQAYQRLVDADLKDMIFARQCGILIHVTPEGLPGREVIWRVTSSGQDVAEFSAVLSPITATQTKVEVKLPADPAGGEIYDGPKFYRRPAFNQPLRPAVEEQVAAILEGRKFDVMRVGPGRDTVCNAQRGGLETGHVFRVDDPPDPSA